MRLKLVSFATCPYVHRARIMLDEKKVPYEIEYIDLQNKPEWFMKISPRGKVPVLIVDGTPLFESSAILEFLDETQAPRFLPDDPIARAKERAWIAFANDLFVAQWEFFTAQSDIEPKRARFLALLDLFEEAAQKPFFWGDRMGLVDVTMAPMLYRFSLVGLFGEKYPKLRAWAAVLTSHDSVTKTVPADFAEKFRAFTPRARAFVGG